MVQSGNWRVASYTVWELEGNWRGARDTVWELEGST